MREGKGDKDRNVELPDRILERLKRQIDVVCIQHANDIERGAGRVWLPYALARKFPNAEREFKWQ
jgi:hypothetical protein